jgi:hypothetical protein
MRREKTAINKIRNEKGETTTNTKEILYSNELENLEEMDKFLNTYEHLKLNQEAANHLNTSITSKESEAEIESLKKEKSKT